MIISSFPQGSEQQHEKRRAAVELLMVPCTTLFCSPGISFKGKSMFKSTLTSAMVYLEKPKHNNVASSLTQVSLKDILLFLHMPTRLWGVGVLSTSFSQLQNRCLGFRYHLAPLCNQQAETGPPSMNLSLQRRNGNNDLPEMPAFPHYCRALADIYENSIRNPDRSSRQKTDWT